MTPYMSPSRIHAQVDLTRAHMQLVIAEVSEQVSRRAENNMKKARKTAQALREVAQAFEDIPQELLSKVNEELNGPQCVVVYRAAECMAAIVEPFRASYNTFLKEHDALVEAEVKQSVERFCVWAVSLPNTLRAFWLAYVNRVEADLAAAAGEQQEITDEWDGVSCDGLDSAA